AFHLPQGVIYLDGNSLGPMPLKTPQRVAQVMREQWAQQLIRAWNSSGWMQQPVCVGTRIGRLIGAEPGSVVVGDTLSLRVYQALAAALQQVPERSVVLSDTGNFPSDLYMARALLRDLNQGHQLRLVEPDGILGAMDETVAVVMLTEVDYRTGRLHDMRTVTARAHETGAVTVWDLAHSAGALPIYLSGTNADFAAGCTYKYLNAGPGAPAFIYVAPRHIENVSPALSGWLGHANPFGFDLEYQPGTGIERMRIGTPPVIAMAALEAALDVWDTVDLEDVRKVSIVLSERFIAEVEARCPGLKLASPRDPAERGSQVSFLYEHGYPLMQALIAKGVIGDYRAPNAMRFGFTPLYLSEEDVCRAVDILEELVTTRGWDRPEYHARTAVT
ncbi:MAG: kynureninase, partial [Chromatiales bacterium]|nr:kynureninase [Chromatiales bacterium]